MQFSGPISHILQDLDVDCMRRWKGTTQPQSQAHKALAPHGECLQDPIINNNNRALNMSLNRAE